MVQAGLLCRRVWRTSRCIYKVKLFPDLFTSRPHTTALYVYFMLSCTLYPLLAGFHER